MKMEVTQSIIIVEKYSRIHVVFFLYKIIGTGHATRNVLPFFGIFILWNNVWCFHCMKCHLYYINVVSC